MKNLGRTQRWHSGTIEQARAALEKRGTAWVEFGTGGMPPRFLEDFPGGLTGGCTRRWRALAWYVGKSLHDGRWYAYGPSGILRTQKGKRRRFTTQETARAAVDKVIRAAER